MLEAEDLLNGYLNGIFPMADNDGQLYWYSPEPRAIIPINSYKPSKSLRPIINQNVFKIKFNTNFLEVIKACSKPRLSENETWISEEIIDAYHKLHILGYAISVEAYYKNELVGGLYGVNIGNAFFGESMFHIMPNASKVAFHYLIEYLKANDYQLLDTQFINDNVKRFGAIEIPKAEYIKLLRTATATSEIFENELIEIA
jgi:leucyl/phenylalanyl-tRNA---protein transferase